MPLSPKNRSLTSPHVHLQVVALEFLLLYCEKLTWMELLPIKLSKPYQRRCLGQTINVPRLLYNETIFSAKISKGDYFIFFYFVNPTSNHNPEITLSDYYNIHYISSLFHLSFSKNLLFFAFPQNKFWIPT